MHRAVRSQRKELKVLLMMKRREVEEGAVAPLAAHVAPHKPPSLALGPLEADRRTGSERADGTACLSIHFTILIIPLGCHHSTSLAREISSA